MDTPMPLGTSVVGNSTAPVLAVRRLNETIVRSDAIAFIERIPRHVV
jgi:hypothetical protein